MKLFYALLLGSWLAWLPMSQAQAAPYFRWEPFKTVSAGGFYRLGSPQVSVGSVGSLLVHHAEDGYLLLPGVGWDLLDVGWTAPTDGGHGSVALGPAIHLDEPIKAVLRCGLHLFHDDYGALDAALAPGTGSWALSVGPAWSLELSDRLRGCQGRFLLFSTLSRKF